MTEETESPEEQEVRRIIRVLREKPGIAEEVRRALLSQELLELPGHFAKFVAKDGDFGSLKDDVKALTGDVGDLKGDVLEDRVRARPDDFLDEHVTGGTVLSRAQVMDLARKAGQGLSLLSVDEAKALRNADLVLVGGRNPESGKRLSAVVEASSRAGRHDVERARNRADILSRHGHTCLAIVVTRYPMEDQWRRLAEEASVVVLTVGSIADAA